VGKQGEPIDTVRRVRERSQVATDPVRRCLL